MSGGVAKAVDADAGVEKEAASLYFGAVEFGVHSLALARRADSFVSIPPLVAVVDDVAWGVS